MEVHFWKVFSTHKPCLRTRSSSWSLSRCRGPVEADVDRAQKKKWYAYEPSTEEVEVILDSGADCHVLPIEGWYDAGQDSKANFVLQDAQGRVIPGASVRENVEFIMMKKDGTKFTIRNQAVLAEVKHPLFALGKLWKIGWSIQHENENRTEKQVSFLTKDKIKIPFWFQQNSSVTTMRITRMESKSYQIRPVFSMSGDLQKELPIWRTLKSKVGLCCQMERQSSLTIMPSRRSIPVSSGETTFRTERP